MVAPLPVTAERRHLTIVFCDMVASTEHADRLDPEDFCRLVQTFLGSCADVIRRHNGVVASYVGDAVKGFFGYPVADEEDAETAVRAGLEIVDTVTALAETLNEPLQVRVGVASGEVVVGHFAGAPAGVSIGAFGHTANVAARLQVLAEPNTVLVDPPTFQASRGAVDYTDIGFHRLKGLQDPVKVWRAGRPRSLPSRFARRAQLTKLSGRDAEMRRLLDLWHSVCASGRGRAAVVSGEPGIGKSRLLHEVQRRTDCANWLLMQCSPTFENSTLYPFLRTFKRWASIDDRETPAETMHRLRSALATIGPDVELRLAVVALLLSLPPEGGERASAISPDRQREIMKSLVLDWIAHLARSEPLLLLFEDAQWADLTSRELLSTLAETGAVVPYLVLVSLRAEAAEPQIAMGDALHLELEPLGRADAESIVRDVVSSGLSGDDLAAVLERAEGVPLFIEELAVHAGDAPRLERPEDDDGASTDAIPTTMQSALLARLDRLQSAKELAQIAATIGREFEIDLLRSVSGYRPDRIRRDLDTLLRSGLLISAEGAQAETLLFKHALLQQAAQATMLRERRQVLHGRIAECLELRDQGGPSAYPELIAHHYTEAGRFDRAADCWFLAGTKTGASWAKLEAARMLRKGLDCARLLADTPERSSRLIRTELELGDVLYAAYGYVTEDGIAAYQRAVALCEETDDLPGLVRALDGLFGTHFNSAQFDEAIRACDRLIAIGEAKGNRAALVLGLQFKGMSVFCQGRLPEASGLLQRALAHRDHASEIGSDFPSMAMLYLSWTWHLLGHHRAALDVFNEAETIVRTQTAYRLAAWLGNGCVLFAFRNDSSKVLALAEELLPLAEANGFNLWAQMARVFKGWAETWVSDPAKGTALMRDTVVDLGRQEVDKTCYLALLSQAYLRSGSHEEAARCVARGLAQAEASGEAYCLALLLVIHGDVEAALGRPERAEAIYRQAITTAQGQEAKSFEHLASARLCAMLAAQARSDTGLERRCADLARGFERSGAGVAADRKGCATATRTPATFPYVTSRKI